MALSSRSTTAPSISSGSRFKRRSRQAGVAPVEHAGAQHLQPADGAVEQRPDERIGGRIPGQRVEAALHGGGGVISLIANTLTVRRTGIDIDCIAAGVHRLRLGDRPGRRAIDGIAPVSRRRADRERRAGSPSRPAEARPVRNGRPHNSARPPPGRPRCTCHPFDETPGPGSSARPCLVRRIAL